MLKRITLAQQAYEELSGRIVSDGVKAGERLTEGRLGGELPISRTPVRSALLKQQQEGLAEPWPPRRYRVKSFTGESVTGLFDCRALLEGEALRLGFREPLRKKPEGLRQKLRGSNHGGSVERHAMRHTGAALHQLIAVPLFQPVYPGTAPAAVPEMRRLPAIPDDGRSGTVPRPDGGASGGHQRHSCRPLRRSSSVTGKSGCQRKRPRNGKDGSAIPRGVKTRPVSLSRIYQSAAWNLMLPAADFSASPENEST